jgi:hypothetical protein
MPLAEGQIQVRDLVMGPGTPYEILSETNPFIRNVRADQSGKRAWGHGSWSGVEWMDEAVVPLMVLTEGATTAEWLASHQTLAAAFRPVGESTSDVEMRFCLGGTEYVMYGRPRTVEPQIRSLIGTIVTKLAFVATDPLIYQGNPVASAPIHLPTYSGGLTVPMTVPFTVTGVATAGFASVTNVGTVDVGLTLRIDGPVPSPNVTLKRNDGSIQRLTFDIELAENEWLDVDTKKRVVLLNGATSRRGQASGQWPIVPPGTHELRWSSPTYNPDATLTPLVRGAWW